MRHQPIRATAEAWRRCSIIGSSRPTRFYAGSGFVPKINAGAKLPWSPLIHHDRVVSGAADCLL